MKAEEVRPLVAKAMLPDSQEGEDSAKAYAVSFRRQYLNRDGYSVRRVHRKMFAHGHEFGFWLVLVLGPLGPWKVTIKRDDGSEWERVYPERETAHEAYERMSIEPWAVSATLEPVRSEEP